jgi:hypothetical protein
MYILRLKSGQLIGQHSFDALWTSRKKFKIREYGHEINVTWLAVSGKRKRLANLVGSFGASTQGMAQKKRASLGSSFYFFCPGSD